MPKKSKKTGQKQKQKQAQAQQVIVNIREPRHKKAKKRPRRRPTAEDKEIDMQRQEYATSLSRLIPPIQYNFPQQSNFGTFEAGQALIPAFRQVANESMQQLIPMLRDRTKNEKTSLGEEPKDPIIPEFEDKKVEPEKMNIPESKAVAFADAKDAVDILKDTHNYTSSSNPIYQDESQQFIQKGVIKRSQSVPVSKERYVTPSKVEIRVQREKLLNDIDQKKKEEEEREKAVQQKIEEHKKKAEEEIKKKIKAERKSKAKPKPKEQVEFVVEETPTKQKKLEHFFK